MEPAKPCELGPFEPGDHTEHAHLLAVAELGLEADHVP